MKTKPKFTAKEERVMQAAYKLFVRNGLARTTMSIVAEYAKVSRPTLYLMFESKEILFAAVMNNATDEMCESIRSTLTKYDSLEDKLMHVCEQWAIPGYDFVKSYPEANVDMGSIELEPVLHMHNEYQRIIVELFDDEGVKFPDGLSNVDYARTLTYSIKGLVETAKSQNDMRKLTKALVKGVLAATVR